jgi:hypothetical protein
VNVWFNPSPVLFEALAVHANPQLCKSCCLAKTTNPSSNFFCLQVLLPSTIFGQASAFAKHDILPNTIETSSFCASNIQSCKRKAFPVYTVLVVGQIFQFILCSWLDSFSSLNCSRGWTYFPVYTMLVLGQLFQFILCSCLDSFSDLYCARGWTAFQFKLFSWLDIFSSLYNARVWTTFPIYTVLVFGHLFQFILCSWLDTSSNGSAVCRVVGLS